MFSRAQGALQNFPKKSLSPRFLIVLVFFFLFAGSAFAQACVDMPALLGYIGDWKAGTMDMPALLGYIGDWKTGTGCTGQTTMTTASRTSGVAPLGIFFDTIDETNWASEVIQPKGFDAQPNITGVSISRVRADTPAGTGTLSFDATAKTLSWQASGDSQGTPVVVSGGKSFELASSGGSKLFVWVEKSLLSGTNATSAVTIVNGGVNADWESFDYAWNFGDASAGNWTTGAKLSNGNYPSKNTALGWNAAHVYENSGNYNASLTITDDMGIAHTYQQSITVSDAPAGGWITYYFAAVGLDTNPCTQTQPCRTWSKAKTLAATNIKLLFNRGDSFEFTNDGSFSPSFAGPFYLGAYGTGEKPRFFTTIDNTFIYGPADARYVDIWIQGSYPAVNGGINYPAGIRAKQNGLILRAKAENSWNAFSVNKFVIIQESTSNNTQAYGTFVAASTSIQNAILGSDYSHGHQEALFRSYGKKTIVEHNNFHDPAPKDTIRFHSNSEPGLSGVWQIVSNNYLLGVGISGGVDCSQNPGECLPHYSHYVIENNFFDHTPGTGSGIRFYGVSFMTVRNNVYYTPNLTETVSFTGLGTAYNDYGFYDVENIRLLNNIYSVASQQYSYLLGMTEDVTLERNVRNIVIANNIVYSPNDNSNLYPSTVRAGTYAPTVDKWIEKNNLVYR